MSRAWEPKDRARAIQWRNHGRTPEFIALRLRRTDEEVRAVLGEATRKKHTPAKQPRKCLCCAREFMSEGAHNRMCDPCRRGSQDIPAAMLPAGDGCSRAGRRSKA